MTVSEVIQNAKSPDGKTIRVCGLAYLWAYPSQVLMQMCGRCIPKTDPSYRQGVVRGWLTIYDSIAPADPQSYGALHNKRGLKISESSFHHSGDYCKIKCSACEGISQRTYEFAGTLQVKQDSELILEYVDLEGSSQLVDGGFRGYVSITNFDRGTFRFEATSYTISRWKLSEQAALSRQSQSSLRIPKSNE